MNTWHPAVGSQHQQMIPMPMMNALMFQERIFQPRNLLTFKGGLKRSTHLHLQGPLLLLFLSQLLQLHPFAPSATRMFANVPHLNYK